jgi:hypothetical protein
MSAYTKISPIAGLILAALLAGIAGGQTRFHKEIPISNETSVVVSLEAAYGTVHIGSKTSGELFISDMLAEPSIDVRTDVNYKVQERTGFLELVLRPVERQRRSWGIDTGTWDLHFNRDVPLKFDIEMGAGRGLFDFSGMHIDRLNMSTGASNVTVRFNEPNKGFIEIMRIESGVSRFTGEKLGNANFGALKFEGGVGSYTLDFDGDLRHEAYVNVELGIGAVTLIIPEHIGVKLNAQQRLFSSVDVPDDLERIGKDEYVSKNFESAAGRLIIQIESGLGSVRVRR